MSEFKEYLRFSEIEKATEYTSVLEKYNIPYELDDSSKRAKIISITVDDPWSDQYILKLRESDIEKAESAFNKELDNEINSTTQEHYLYTFADKDILEIIANQNEWTKAEVKLAMEIAKDRKLDLSAQTIKSAKKTKEEKPQLRSTIKTSASLFWIIAVFTIANSVLTRRGINFHLPGLAIAEVFEKVFADLYGTGNRIGFVTCLLISAIFFLFARYGKKNKWVFLAGLIVYCLDSILIFFSPRWGSMIFIFIVLWSMVTALVNTFKDDEKLQTGSGSNG